MNGELASTAALLSDPARASILMSLMGGIALPAGHLAMIANIAPQTASSHLSQLVSRRLLTVEQQGRHRYYRLAGAEVAAAIESLLTIAPRHATNGATKLRMANAPEMLVYARTCYSHLAGRLAVEIASALERQDFLKPHASNLYLVTDGGRRWFEELGISITDSQMRNDRFARQCLDWTERRHHLAGHLGCALLDRFRELKWIACIRNSRAVRVTIEGQRRIRKLLDLKQA